MGSTPLHKAAERCNDAMTSVPLAKVATLTAKQADPQLTPLIIAIEKNRPSIVKFLLDAGAEHKIDLEWILDSSSYSG